MAFSIPIPEDVISLIINELPPQRDVLLTCSLISRSFVAPCQKRLFSTVDISSFRGIEKCKKLHKLFTHSPHLAWYIRNLTLQNGQQMVNGELQYVWLLRQTNIPPLLDMLPALQSFDLKSISHRLEWGLMPRPLQASLIRIFTLPSLEMIRLHNVKVPAAVFSHSTQLVELGLLRSEVDQSIDVQSLLTSFADILRSSSPNPEKPRLRALSITSEMTETFVEDLSFTLDLSNLHELNLTGPYRATLDAIAVIMQNSVERFKWSVPELIDDGRSETCPLTLTSKIRSLQVSVFSWEEIKEALNPIRWAIRALQELAIHEGIVDLEELTVAITTIPFPRQYYIHLISRCGYQWSQLDQILTQDNVFVNLRQVTIVLHHPDWGHATQWVEPMRKKLPRLAARGILLVK